MICRSRSPCWGRWVWSMRKCWQAMSSSASLGLDGRDRAGSPGVLLAALHASGRDYVASSVPPRRVPEAAWAGAGGGAGRAGSACTLINHLKGGTAHPALARRLPRHEPPVRIGPDLAQVKGQETAQACAGDRCGRRAQSDFRRPARRGQVADGERACPAFCPPLTPAGSAGSLDGCQSVAGTLNGGRISAARGPYPQLRIIPRRWRRWSAGGSAR